MAATTGISDPAITNFSNLSSYIQIKDDTSVFFTKEELDDFLIQINREREESTRLTNIRFARDFIYPCTAGFVNQATTNAVIEKITTTYTSTSSRGKGLGLFKRFLHYLENTKDGVRLTSYIKQIEAFKLKKSRKINRDIILDNDIKNLINHIKTGKDGIKDPDNAISLVFFGAYTGMRQATCDRLTVKHVRNALSLSHPCILVNPEIDKTSTEHFVPIHPQLIPILKDLVKDLDDNDTIFSSKPLTIFLTKHRLNRSNDPTEFLYVKHLRKYFIQRSTILSLNNDFRDYIVSNQVNGIQWAHYKNFTFQQVYDAYLQAWGQIQFVDKENLNQ
ncbi:hypothetical protein [Methanosphaerula subterraneus]|uniref:hypothetical protein n=1 Tax=Methanosphaerula subterraneus TaxID=3350244 RepID=UPI003F86BB9E